MTKKIRPRVIDTESLQIARIPMRFWNMNRDNYFGDESALNRIERYGKKARIAFDRGLGIVLRGESESGKTWLVTYLLKNLMLDDFDVHYTTLDDLTEFMVDGDEKFSTKFSKKSFVAIDDIVGPNGGTLAALRKFLRVMIDNNLPFILATPYLRENNQDPFCTSFHDCGVEKVLSMSLEVNCSVNQFRIKKYHEDLKKGFI